MANKVEKRDIRKTSQMLGTYFNQGQITYGMTVNGKTHVAADTVPRMPKYGPFEGADAENMTNIVPERYIIDYIWENASNTSVFYVIFKERSLLDPLMKEIESKLQHSVAIKISEYVLKIESDGKDAEETPAVIPKPAASPMLPGFKGRPQFLHVGIPVTDKKPNMTYIENFKVWITDPANYEFDIEYLKYEEGTPFPPVLHKNPHIAYMVEDMKPYIAKAQQVIFPPTALTDQIDFAYIMWDDTIFELQAKRK